MASYHTLRSLERILNPLLTACILFSQEPFGSIYCQTFDGKIIHLESNYRFSNGLAVKHSKSGRPEKLIVAETPTRLLWSYDIDGPGKISGKTHWGKLPGTSPFYVTCMLLIFKDLHRLQVHLL